MVPAPGRRPGARDPFWTVPHLLGVDAAAVALTWQVWWAHLLGISLAWCHHLVLGLAVWMIYLADRLCDGRRAAPGELTSARHRFARRHPRPLTGLLAAVWATLVWVAPRFLPPAEWRAGLVLLGLAGTYFCLVHALPGRPRPPLPKEAWVGLLFAVGTACFPACRVAAAPAGGALPPTWPATAGRVALFAVLCFLNCAFITAWERPAPGPGRPRPPGRRPWPGTAALGPAALALGLLAAALHAGPVALGALGLWLLDRPAAAAALPPVGRRVAADAVLLTPWLFLG